MDRLTSVQIGSNCRLLWTWWWISGYHKNGQLLMNWINQVRNKRLCAMKIVNLKNSLFWDITLCRWVKINRPFGGTYRLHLQGWRASQARNQRKAGKRPSYISQKAELFIDIAVKISNPSFLIAKSVLFYYCEWREQQPV
jgi:hypothetical protein